MTSRPNDQHAVRIPQMSGLLPCLYVPIAARDTCSIETYVGKIRAYLASRMPCKALLVEAHEPEKWAVEYLSSPRMREINKASKAAVQYADLSDIVKMLNMEGGGSLMETVNDAQKLVDIRTSSATGSSGLSN